MSGRAKLASRALRTAEVLGLALTLIAIAWWAIVYAQVMANTGFAATSTLPCLIYTSDRCSLAMALCKDWHFLGIKRYSEEMLWAGVALCAIALLAGNVVSGSGRRS